MKIFAYMMAGSIFCSLAASPASAAVPVGTTVALEASELIVPVHYTGRKHGHPYRYGKRARAYKYRPGYRYSNPPANWRRYDARPGDWQTRGCVIVGPIWFCP